MSPSPFSDLSGTSEYDPRRLFGAPTYGEAAATAEGQVMNQLSALHAKSGNPQQAIVDFLKTPAGAKYISDMAMAKKDPIDTLNKWVNTVTPPTPEVTAPAPGMEGSPIYQRGPGKVSQIGSVPPQPHNLPQGTMQVTGGQVTGNNPQGPIQVAPSHTLATPEGKPLMQAPGLPHNVGPGSSAIDPNTGRPLVNQPTTELQNFGGLSAAMNSSDPNVARYAALALGGDKSAWLELARTGAIDRATAEKGMAGAFMKMPIVNNAGQPVGDVIVDVTSGKVAVGNIPGLPANLQAAPASAPGSQSGTPAAAPSNQPVNQADLGKVIQSPKESMALGMGLNPMLRNAAGIAFRTLDPRFDDPNSEVAGQRRQAEQMVYTALTSHPDAAGRLKTQIDALTKLLPSQGWITDPVDALNKLGQLRDFAENSYNSDKQVWDQGAGVHAKESVVEAEKSMQGWQRVLSTLPSRESINLLKAAVKQGSSGVETPASVAGGVAQGAVKAIPGAVGGAVNAVTGAVGGPQTQSGELAVQQKLRSMDDKTLNSLDMNKVNPQVRALIQAERQRRATGGK